MMKICLFILCFIVPLSSYAYNPLTVQKEPTFGTNVSVYTSDPNEPKTHGRKIRIEYPKSWEAKPGISPNNLYKFTDTNYKGKLQGRACVITIKDMGASLLTKDWELLFLDPDFINQINEGVDSISTKVLYTKATHADSLPALMSMSEMIMEQLGIKLYSKSLNLLVGYKNTLMNFSCMSLGQSQNMANVLFESSKEEFLQFMNSFKCMDRWENSGKDEIEIYDQKFDQVFKSSTETGNYQEVADFLYENMDIGTVCMNSKTDLQIMKDNPNILLEYSKILQYYVFTHWIKEYCKPYAISDKVINNAKTILLARKTNSEKKITEIMGTKHVSCLDRYLSSSDDGQNSAYEFLDSMRVELLGLTTKDFCAEFNNETQTKMLFKSLAEN